MDSILVLGAGELGLQVLPGPARIAPQHAPSACKTCVISRTTSRALAEHLSCSLRLLGFVPMHSDSQHCLNVAI
jgi:hypothetical protein